MQTVRRIRKRSVPAGTMKGLMGYIAHLRDKAEGNRKHAETHPEDGAAKCLAVAEEYENTAKYLEIVFAKKLSGR